MRGTNGQSEEGQPNAQPMSKTYLFRHALNASSDQCSTAGSAKKKDTKETLLTSANVPGELDVVGNVDYEQISNRHTNPRTKPDKPRAQTQMQSYLRSGAELIGRGLAFFL